MEEEGNVIAAANVGIQDRSDPLEKIVVKAASASMVAEISQTESDNNFTKLQEEKINEPSVDAESLFNLPNAEEKE